MLRSQAAPLLAGLLLLCGLHAASAVQGEAFLGDLNPATQQPINQGTYTDQAPGGGTVSIIDQGTGYSWEVNVFDAPVPKSIDLVLAQPGLPVVIPLTAAPSADGTSFGTLAFSDVDNALKASANPNANLRDGSVGVVVRFDDLPNGKALVADIVDGSAVTDPVEAAAPTAAEGDVLPDQYALHPGVDPLVYYSILDGSQVYILESGITLGGNGTSSILIYDWKDGTYTWELENNNVADPQGLTMRIFSNLVDQPVLFDLVPDQPWSKDTISYTGNFTKAQLTEALARVGRPDATLEASTPDIFLEIVDRGVVEEEVLDPVAAAPAGAVGSIKDFRRRLSSTQEEAQVEARARLAQQKEAHFRRRLAQSLDYSGQAPTNGTCSSAVESRILGFIYNTKSLYKLKPVVKDTNSLPTSIEMYPVYASAAVLFVCLVVFIAMYISGTLEEALA